MVQKIIFALMMLVGTNCSNASHAFGVLPPTSYSKDYSFECRNGENGKSVQVNMALKHTLGNLVGQLEFVTESKTHIHQQFQYDVVDNYFSVDTMVGWCDAPYGAVSGITLTGSSSDGLRKGVVYRVMFTAKEKIHVVQIDEGVPF